MWPHLVRANAKSDEFLAGVAQNSALKFDLEYNWMEKHLN